MRYSILIGLLSLIPLSNCRIDYRKSNPQTISSNVNRYDIPETTNDNGSIREVYKDDYNSDGIIDCIMTSTFSGNVQTDEVDVNADGKIDIRCVIRYLEDGRMHIRFDGDGDGVFEDDFYYRPEPVDI